MSLISQTDRALSGTLDTHYKQAPQSSKPLYATPGIARQLFIDIVRAACIIHSLSNAEADEELWLDPKAIKKYLVSSVALSDVQKVVKSENFTQALILRGVINLTKTALSGEQLRALAVLTDVTSHASLETKLKRAGIPRYKWDVWMNNPLFRAAHDKLAHDIFLKAQSSVDTQVVSGALQGKLEFIKYYNEITGRHSPGRRAHDDVQSILNDIVDIVTRNVQDPLVLQRISSELSASVAKLG
jgi:hypothetical protein